MTSVPISRQLFPLNQSECNLSFDRCSHWLKAVLDLSVGDFTYNIIFFVSNSYVWLAISLNIALLSDFQIYIGMIALPK